MVEYLNSSPKILTGQAVLASPKRAHTGAVANSLLYCSPSRIWEKSVPQELRLGVGISDDGLEMDTPETGPCLHGMSSV